MQLKITNKSSESEKELVKGCINNDRNIQKTLYDRYKNAMYSTAYRIIGNTEIAHDALQESFIDIFENIESYRFESTLGAWMKIIVVRKSIKKLKSIKEFETLEIADKIVSPEADCDFTAEELEKAIQSLPDSARAIFLLIEVEGYKHQEVAEILKISIGTSKSQLSYSKKLLQRRLYEKI
jgi:RNA polymerase sigma factor (sigma-70 family)